MSAPNTEMAFAQEELRADIYVNPSAATYVFPSSASAPNSSNSNSAQVHKFHSSLPDFAPTPLHSLPVLADNLGIGSLLVKSESSRLGLPAFKILGASWGVYRAVCEVLGLEADPEVNGIDALQRQLEQARKGLGGGIGKRYVLYAATDGNHGRAVARMAKILMGGFGEDRVGERNARIYVPEGMYETTKRLIEGEGAEVITVAGDYDEAVRVCWEASREGGRQDTETKEEDADANVNVVGIMVQDNAFDGYNVVPGWIVEGYATLLAEVDHQFEKMVIEVEGREGRKITHIVTPIGVGSLGKAVVKWAKDGSRTNRVGVIACEPETAACLNVSLRNGDNTTIETVDTIMSGMCCGTVSPTSWEALRDGVDASVTIDDWSCHETVLDLRERYQIDAGPCGAGCMAGLRKLLASSECRRMLSVDEKSVIVVLSTEGRREYPVPIRSG